MSFTINIKDFDKVKAIADRFPAETEKAVRHTINRSLLHVLREEKKEAPFGVTGNLRDRWDVITGYFNGRLVSGVK